MKRLFCYTELRTLLPGACGPVACPWACNSQGGERGAGPYSRLTLFLGGGDDPFPSFLSFCGGQEVVVICIPSGWASGGRIGQEVVVMSIPSGWASAGSLSVMSPIDA